MYADVNYWYLSDPLDFSGNKNDAKQRRKDLVIGRQRGEHESFVLQAMDFATNKNLSREQGRSFPFYNAYVMGATQHGGNGDNMQEYLVGPLKLRVNSLLVSYSPLSMSSTSRMNVMPKLSNL